MEKLRNNESPTVSPKIREKKPSISNQIVKDLNILLLTTAALIACEHKSDYPDQNAPNNNFIRAIAHEALQFGDCSETRKKLINIGENKGSITIRNPDKPNNATIRISAEGGTVSVCEGTRVELCTKLVDNTSHCYIVEGEK